MINYYKYLPVSEDDKKWGLHVLNAGCNHIPKAEVYPEPCHPSHHYFNWEQGRVFNEYQVIYISKGEGVFESETCPATTVREGTVIMLFPDEWHRFKPNPDTGWDEAWTGFEGNIIHNLVQHNFFSRSHPLLYIGLQETVVHLLSDIIEKTKIEKPGYQPVIAGSVLQLLGHLHALAKQAMIRGENVSEALINKAILILRNRAFEDYSVESVAEDLNVSYSWLRKTFKLYTGIAPGQYLLQIKINKAKMLLNDSQKSIKEIAFESGFVSSYYFSKIFKIKMGISPEVYRRENQTNFHF